MFDSGRRLEGKITSTRTSKESRLSKALRKEGSSMSLKLNIRETNGVSVVDASGRVTLGDGAGELRETLRELANSGHRQILLNLGEISYLDSSGIGVLVGAFATQSKLGGALKLLNLSGH